MTESDRKFEEEFFKQKSSGSGRSRRSSKSKTLSINANSAGNLNEIVYEIKPIVYLAFALGFLRSSGASVLTIKYASLGILVFCGFIIYRRLEARGYL